MILPLGSTRLLLHRVSFQMSGSSGSCELEPVATLLSFEVMAQNGPCITKRAMWFLSVS